MSDDRKRVRELLELDHLGYSDVQDLKALVERNQNDGVFSEAEWIALRGWVKTESDRRMLRAQAIGVFLGTFE